MSARRSSTSGRTFGIRNWARGSPGARYTSRNEITATPRRMGTAGRARPPRSTDQLLAGDLRQLVSLPAPVRRVELELAIVVLHASGEAISVDVRPCEQVRLKLLHALLVLEVNLGPLRLIRGGKALLDEAVDLVVLQAHVVVRVRLVLVRALRTMEQRVRVGIDADAPPTEVGVPRLGLPRGDVRVRQRGDQDGLEVSRIDLD